MIMEIRMTQYLHIKQSNNKLSTKSRILTEIQLRGKTRESYLGGTTSNLGPADSWSMSASE